MAFGASQNVVTSPLNRSKVSFGNFGLITVGCCGSGCAAEAWPIIDPLSPMSPCDGSLIVSFSVNLAKISTILVFASAASSISLSIASTAHRSRISSSYTCNTLFLLLNLIQDIQIASIVIRNFLFFVYQVQSLFCFFNLFVTDPLLTPLLAFSLSSFAFSSAMLHFQPAPSWAPCKNVYVDISKLPEIY